MLDEYNRISSSNVNSQSNQNSHSNKQDKSDKSLSNLSSSNKPKFYNKIKESAKQNLELERSSNNSSIVHRLNDRSLNRSQVKNSVVKIFQERIFWTKEQIVDMRNKLKEGCQKILLKKQQDWEEIDYFISTPSEQSAKEIKDKITDVVFKNFYYKEMRSSELLDRLFKNGFPKLVRELIDEDPHYFVFDFNLIVNLFEENLQQKDIVNNSAVHQQLQSYLGEAIKYDLYSRESSYLLAYLSSLFQFYNEFKEIVNKDDSPLEDELEIFNNFNTVDDIRNFRDNPDSLSTVLGYCLKHECEKIAILLFKAQQKDVEEAVIFLAIDSNKINFLQYLWEFWNKNVAEKLNQSKWVFPIKESVSEALILDNQLDDLKFINNSIKFTIHDLIVLIFAHEKERNNIISGNNNNNATGSNSNSNTNLNNSIKSIYNNSEKKIEIVTNDTPSGNISSMINSIISKWEFLEHDRKLLETLFKYKLYDEISVLIRRNKYKYWTFKEEHFENVIKNQQLNLICFFLEKMPNLRHILNNNKIQEIIVYKYMKFGNKIYYGTEMLTSIYKNNWSQDLTKELCKSIARTIITKDILNCHSPILTCVLLSEFLSNVGSISVLHYSRTEKTMKELLQFCENIQNSSNDESYIKFLMSQKNVYGRSAFQISAENDYYQCLNNPNIGTLVGKMWNGEISQISLFKASSLQRFLESNKNKQTDPFLEFEPVDSNKSYFFQLSVWEDSCSLRYWPESILTLLLIINYNIFIYLLTLDGKYNGDWHSIRKTDNSVLIIYIIYLVQVICININTLLNVTFSVVTKRKIRLTYWNLIEFIMLFLALVLNIDFNKDETDIKYDDTSSIIETSLLCLNDVIVWLRIAGVLLTFKNLGPVIRMVYLMALLLLRYIMIYCLFIVCLSAVFNAIFFGSSNSYKDFNSTVISLTTPFVNEFETDNFVENNLFGKIMVMLYVSLSAILLINLLIAVLSSVYDELSKQVDASHRAVLINYYQKYQWDKRFGYLQLLPATLSVINLFVLPIQLLIGSKDNEKQENFNKIVCKIYFSILYFPLIFLTSAIYTLFLLPFCYIKCIATVIKLQFSFKGSQAIKILILLKTLFFGFLFLFYFYIRDLYLLYKYQFKEPIQQQTNIDRIKNFITTDDILIFLEFIHSRSPKALNTLNIIFNDYLFYEQDKKIQSDFKIKAKADYLEKLKNKLASTNTSTIMFNPTMHPKNSLGKIEGEMSTYADIKKKLIIIEILENFLIESDNDDYHVDLEKLKLLLPKGLEINDDYILRLIHTDISSINKAVNKLKTSKNVLLQYQLVSKIMNNVIKIDKDIDYEIQKNLLVKRSEKRDNNYIEASVGFDKMIKIMRNIVEFSKVKMHKREKKLLRERKIKDSSKLMDETTNNKTNMSDFSKNQAAFKRKQTIAKNFGVTIMSNV